MKQEKIFANHIHDEGLISKIHKELKKKRKKKELKPLHKKTNNLI